jgi:hypothetical protein
MTNVIQKLALTGLLALATGAVFAGTSVNYVNQERFTDLPAAASDRELVLKELTQHFDKLGKQLPPGQELLVEITDIDLAGRENVGRWPRDLRIVAGVDWPRIHMRFSVVSQGQVLRSGDLQLRDMAFKDRHSRYSNGDGLRYEKRMLDDWFQLTIAPQERTARR